MQISTKQFYDTQLKSMQDLQSDFCTRFVHRLHDRGMVNQLFRRIQYPGALLDTPLEVRRYATCHDQPNATARARRIKLSKAVYTIRLVF